MLLNYDGCKDYAQDYGIIELNPGQRKFEPFVINKDGIGDQQWF